MIRSPNLIGLISQHYAVLSDEKAANIAQDLFSKEDGFIAIGSGTDEWWQDAAITKRGYQNRIKAGGSEAKILKMEAFQEGSVGWVIDRVLLKTPKAISFLSGTPTASIYMTGNGKSFKLIIL